MEAQRSQIDHGKRGRIPGAQRRVEILAAARHLFAERGFATTTIREVAAASGISDALIYRHFASKEAILAELIDEGIKSFAKLGPPADIDLRGVPLHAILNNLGKQFLTAIDGQLDLLVLIISEQNLLKQDDRFVQFIHESAVNLGDLIDYHYPEPGVKGRGLPESGSNNTTRVDRQRGYFLARAFMGSLVALALLQKHLGLARVHSVSEDDYIEVVVQSFINGLAES